MWSLSRSYSLVRSADGTFGNRLPNGTGTGMVGMVSRKVRIHTYRFVTNTFLDKPLSSCSLILSSKLIPRPSV